MNEHENVQLVKDHFAAFGHGDLQSALTVVAEDVDWQSPATRTYPAEITWASPRHTREQVAQFFEELGEKVQTEQFDISAITAQGERVVVVGRNRGRVRATGRSYEHDWVMVFTIRDRKIVRHRHYYDTSDVVIAFH
jgi:ketosteroid isomerase-like protein